MRTVALPGQPGQRDGPHRRASPWPRHKPAVAEAQGEVLRPPGAAVADAGPAATTPWAFRHRGLVLGLIYGASAFLSTFAWRRQAWPVTRFDRYLALDPSLWIVQRLDAAPATHVGEIAIPVAFLAVCFALRAWGTSYLRGHIMADKAMHSDRLIVAGPFRWLRNPLYLGNLFMAAAFGLLLPPPGLLLVLGGHMVFLGLLARLEGRGLRARHGAAYDAYARQVWAFVPKPPGPGVPDATVQPDWRNGLATEAWHLGFAAYLVGLALRDTLLLWIGVGATMAVFLANHQRNRRARAQEAEAA
jgi:protein-S-isoprenylcysteine O-methyltransferase Ste14